MRGGKTEDFPFFVGFQALAIVCVLIFVLFLCVLSSALFSSIFLNGLEAHCLFYVGARMFATCLLLCLGWDCAWQGVAGFFCAPRNRKAVATTL